MPDLNEKNDSSAKQDTPIGVISSSGDMPSELFDTHKALLQSVWAAWKLHRLADPIKYTRLSVVTLTQAGAICALDVGMTEEQFLATCKANYAEAVKNAPRWG